MPKRPVTSEQPSDAPAASDDGQAAPSNGSDWDDHPSGLAIIASKIAPEPRGRTILARDRLLGWLEQQDARVVVVSAEAGFGKSTLLSEFARRSAVPCVWYRMEPSDGDWITFLSYMVAALRGALPGFGSQTEALLRHVAAMGSSRELVVAQFLAELGDIGDVRLTAILDDYHLAGESEDVRHIVSRLLELAPPGMRFILGMRGRPKLALGRLAARGRVAELTTEDLRFSRLEIEDLFSTALGHPLDRHACDVVADRTQGWAASLRLVSASIAASHPSEVGAFIEALHGAAGPTYDFLAEEVLNRMSPSSERVLLHASLVDDVTPELVTAALSATDDPIDGDAVAAYLDDARSLGLLGAAGSAAGTSRIHPLLREFLDHQLTQGVPPDRIRDMHLAIARSAERTDWLAAAKHYALAGRPVESMRVLGSAASEALGTGAWGAAVAVVALVPDTPPPPAVEVIKARAIIATGRSRPALQLLDDIDRRSLNPTDRALLALTRAAAFHLEGNAHGLATEVTSIAADDEVGPPLRDVALTWRQLILASQGGCITDASEQLQQLAVAQRALGLRYFAGVALHNAAGAELARGRYAEAHRLAVDAIEQLSMVSDGGGIAASTRSVAATAVAECGQLAEGLRKVAAAATEPGATADAIAEAAYLHAIAGRTERARSYLAIFERGDARWSSELPSRAQACYARVALHVGSGNPSLARDAWRELQAMDGADIDARSRTSVVTATLAILEGLVEAPALTAHAIEACSDQHAWRWMCRARLLDAAARRDGEGLAFWIEEAATESALVLLELADVIAVSVGLLSTVPAALERSILETPSRWVTALGRQVAEGKNGNASAAAALIARFGSLEDAHMLREFDRAQRGRSRKRGYVSQLIRRVSPTVRVHDLGSTSYEIGDRCVTLTETRRKAASLLLFQVTRPNLAATREQVMEGLWPDQTPKSAANSLHQTLFHLRRDIEPWYEDGFTADYVRMEADMVFLDTELFQVDSIAFSRQVADILRRGSARDRGPEMLRLYRGVFAPEFEYEEWSEAWRASLHGAYLHLAQSTVAELMRERRYEDAVDVLTPVTNVDPGAYELRSALIACLAALGSTDAAQSHYKSLAALHHRDVGVQLAPYDEILRGLGM